MCGQALSGQDIGGFESRWVDLGNGSSREEKWVDPALLIRWTIAGAFMPWFRNHYHGGSKYFQEPFNFEDWFDTEEARKLNFKGLPEPQDLYRKVVPACRCGTATGRFPAWLTQLWRGHARGQVVQCIAWLARVTVVHVPP